MKFDDPLNATCSSCGKTGSYPVAALLSLEAKCTACGGSLADAVESMHRLTREVDNFAIAARLALEIEDLDTGIAFDDADLEGVVCLDGIIGLTERKLLAASRTSPRNAAEELVQTAVARVFPGVHAPGSGVELADAFPQEVRSNMWNW